MPLSHAAGRLRTRRVPVRGLMLHERAWLPSPAQAGRPPVVLVHGLGMSGRSMVPLAECLACRFPVLAPDLPGFGLSDAPPRALSVPELADALAAWMDAAGLGGQKVVLLGNSLGCEIAVAFARRWPGRVARLVLQGPPPDADRRGLLLQAASLLAIAPFERPSLLGIALMDYFRAGPLRFLRTARHMARHGLRPHLPHVAAPSLVVVGTRDFVVPRLWAEEVARLLPRGELAVVEGGAHAMNWSHPRELAAAITPWLAG